MRDSLPGGSVAKLYATLWRHAEGRRHKVVLFVVLLVLAQIVRLTIPWFFGEAVNALQAHGMEGITRARNDLLLMLAAVGVAWTMHGPARILERFTALVDCLGNIATVLTLRLQEPMRMMLRSRLLAVFAPLRRNIVFNEVKWGGIDLLNSGMRTGLVALYAWLDFRQHGTISVGTAVVVHQYSQQVGNVVASMAMHWNDLVRQKTEVGDVDPIFASPARSVDNAAVPRTWRDIRVEGVRYVHPAAGVGRPALDDVSMELRRGQRIALIGESGAGKSSLLRVLAGLVDAERVSITVDATPHPHLKHLGAVSLLLPQDPAVFESSVRENVTMGLPYREADIDRACELAGLTSVIAQLPQGFDTLISERGLNLSGGQKQRLALARGLLAASDVGLVLLDEATSSVDASTEAEIYDRVMSAFAGACIVSSVHRLHLLRRFDTVMVMEQGRVVDSGAPEEVRQRRPDVFAHSAMEVVAETRAA